MSNSDIRIVISENEPIGVQMEYTTNYNKLTNKPSINGVVLQGNKTTEELGIVTGDGNWELIKTETFDNTVRSVLFDTDTQGNSFELNNFQLIFRIDHSASINNGVIWVKNASNDNPVQINGSNYICYVSGNNKYICGYMPIGFNYNSIVGVNYYGGVSAIRPPSSVFYDNTERNITPPFTAIQVTWVTYAENGGTIELWGVRK